MSSTDETRHTTDEGAGGAQVDSAHERTRQSLRRANLRAEAAEVQVAALTARLGRGEALVDEFECGPPGQRPPHSLHRVACPGCYHADRVRAALAEPAEGGDRDA